MAPAAQPTRQRTRCFRRFHGGGAKLNRTEFVQQKHGPTASRCTVRKQIQCRADGGWPRWCNEQRETGGNITEKPGSRRKSGWHTHDGGGKGLSQAVEAAQ